MPELCLSAGRSAPRDCQCGAIVLTCFCALQVNFSDVAHNPSLARAARAELDGRSPAHNAFTQSGSLQAGRPHDAEVLSGVPKKRVYEQPPQSARCRTYLLAYACLWASNNIIGPISSGTLIRRNATCLQCSRELMRSPLTPAVHRWRGRGKRCWQWTLRLRRRAPSTESLRMSCALAWTQRAEPQKGSWECCRCAEGLSSVPPGPLGSPFHIPILQDILVILLRRWTFS